MVFQQNLLEKDYFIFKMTGLVMVPKIFIVSPINRILYGHFFKCRKIFHGMQQTREEKFHISEQTCSVLLILQTPMKYQTIILYFFCCQRQDLS